MGSQEQAGRKLLKILKKDRLIVQVGVCSWDLGFHHWKEAGSKEYSVSLRSGKSENFII